MNDIFVCLVGAALAGFTVGALFLWGRKLCNRLRTRKRRFRYLA
jgi:hypothetical protein